MRRLVFEAPRPRRHGLINQPPQTTPHVGAGFVSKGLLEVEHTDSAGKLMDANGRSALYQCNRFPVRRFRSLAQAVEGQQTPLVALADVVGRRRYRQLHRSVFGLVDEFEGINGAKVPRLRVAPADPRERRGRPA